MSEAVVFLPSMMSDARLFGPQLAEFSSKYPVTVMPVHHGERIEEIASSLLTLAPAKFALVGAGLGGIVGMELIRRAPERITRIALIGASPLADTPQEAADREPNIISAKVGRFEEVLDKVVTPGHLAPTPHRIEVHRLMVDMAHQIGSEGFVRQSRAMQRRRDYQSVLRKCRAPAMVICGAQDTLLPIKRHSFLSELIPFAQLRVIEGAAGAPTLEQPDQVADALHEWMAQPLVLQ